MALKDPGSGDCAEAAKSYEIHSSAAAPDLLCGGEAGCAWSRVRVRAANPGSGCAEVALGATRHLQEGQESLSLVPESHTAAGAGTRPSSTPWLCLRAF